MSMTRAEVGALILQRIGSLGWTRAQLAREAGVDPNTIGDLVRGRRVTAPSTQIQVERALGWPEGSLSALERGRLTEDELVAGRLLTRTDESPGVSGRPRPGTVDLPPEVEAGLSPQQAAEVRAHAYAEAMRRRREIINGA